jgi:hypothetical protein
MHGPVDGDVRRSSRISPSIAPLYHGRRLGQNQRTSDTVEVAGYTDPTAEGS